jgi:polyphosphate kinase
MDGMTPWNKWRLTRREILPLTVNHANCWSDEIIPALAKEDICIKNFNTLPDKQKGLLRKWFTKVVLPSMKKPLEGFDGNSIENLHIKPFHTQRFSRKRLLLRY